MKRDKRLYPLSWEHHDLLIFADRVKMALTTFHPSYRQSSEELLEKSKTFWNTVFVNHMNAEKEILFPSLVKYPGEFQEEFETLNKEFDELFGLYSDISILLPSDHGLKDKLLRFAEVIIHHVRYEERTLFPKLQIRLSDIEFDQIGDGLQRKLPRLCRSPLK